MSKANMDIRQEAQEEGVYLWQIADKLGIQDSTFSRKLRRELPNPEKERIYGIINQIKAV
ncbi:MAG: hypothetical protein FWF85_08365 [Clostridiales bacterium]|nr:hypothetical protein [Clostridiales bacterium]